jgi:hypothetical protein
MLKFGEHVTHILDCPETAKPENARLRAFMHTNRVRQICPLLIPVTQSEMSDYNLQMRSQVDQVLMADSNNKLRHVHAKIGLAFDMFPKKSAKFDLTGVVEMTQKFMIDSQRLANETLITAKQLADVLLEPSVAAKIKDQAQPDPFTDVTNEPQILFLGTSSMKPGNYRGASAILYVNNQRGILMDCAEGSYGQLYDHLGDKKRVDDALLKLKVVFITHIHGDHQLGILKILQERDTF